MGSFNNKEFADVKICIDTFKLFLQVRVMERRFNDTDWQPSMSNGSKNMSSSTISDSKCVSAKNNDDYNIGTNEKDRLIRDLESEVEQQRQLRLADAKQVEAKAARIKVCHK